MNEGYAPQKYKSLKGQITFAPILKIGSKSGKPWCEFALVLDKGDVVKCIAFNDVAERLCKTLKDNTNISCLVTEKSEGTFQVQAFNAPKMGEYQKPSNYIAEPRATTTIDWLCDKLGTNYVNERLKQWRKAVADRKGYDVTGYKQLIKELEDIVAKVEAGEEVKI